MHTESIRSTIYLEPALHQALWLKAAATRRSMSEIVNEAIRTALRSCLEKVILVYPMDIPT
jgi:predicted HicB family RNase H-like nuclease